MTSNNIPKDVKKLAKEAGITIDAAKAHAAFVDGRIKAFTAELVQKVDNLTAAQQANVEVVKNDESLKGDPEVRKDLTDAAKKTVAAQDATDKVADKVDVGEPVMEAEVKDVAAKVEEAEAAVDRSKLTIEERMKMAEDDVEGLKQARGRHGRRLNNHEGRIETIEAKLGISMDSEPDAPVEQPKTKQSAAEKAKGLAAKRKELGFVPSLLIAMIASFLIGFFGYALVTWFIDGWNGTFKEAFFVGLIGAVIAAIYLWRRVSRDDKKVDEAEAAVDKTDTKTLVGTH